MNTIEEVINYHNYADKIIRYEHIYKTFLSNVINDIELKNSFELCDGFGELSFSWNWKLIVDKMPINFKFLEIGVYKGRVLAQIGMLASRINKNVELYGITPLSTDGDKYSNYTKLNYYEEIIKNLKKCNVDKSKLTIIKGFSQNENILYNAKKFGNYDIIFIDGCHDYDIVIKDIMNYSPLLNINGYLIMDDSSLYIEYPYGKFLGHPDVSKAASKIDELENFKYLYAVGHNRVWQKIY